MPVLVLSPSPTQPAQGHCHFTTSHHRTALQVSAPGHLPSTNEVGGQGIWTALGVSRCLSWILSAACPCPGEMTSAQGGSLQPSLCLQQVDRYTWTPTLPGILQTSWDTFSRKPPGSQQEPSPCPRDSCGLSQHQISHDAVKSRAGRTVTGHHRTSCFSRGMQGSRAHQQHNLGLVSDLPVGLRSHHIQSSPSHGCWPHSP